MKNQKINLFIFCVCAFLVTGFALKSSGQSLANYQGIWNATDQSGNKIVMKLNADWTCSYTINSVPSYNIVFYKLRPLNGTDATTSAEMELLLITNIATATSSSSNINLSANSSPNLIYQGLVSIDGPTLNNLHLRVSFDQSAAAAGELVFSK